MEILNRLSQAIIDGDSSSTQAHVSEALSLQVEAGTILHSAMIPAMAKVGTLFEEGEYFVPEMLIAARAMQAGLAILKPHLTDSDVKPQGKVVIGTVRGDLHDIGKNLVALMLEGAGFEVMDLGTDVTPEKFVDAVQSGSADVLAMSALLTTTLPQMKSTIEVLERSGFRHQVKIIIGGAPVTAEYAQAIGADGYSEDASRAVSLAKSLIQ
jgi:5-methyltetrahydrofolate--homocysteine methyltransferase